MSSLLTNTAAMTALSTLQMTNKSLDDTQNRISTGLRVAEASDNAAYWSIATTMKSDNRSLSAVKDSLGIGAATIDTAYTGMTAVKDVLDEIKAKLTTATGENVDKTKVMGEIAQLQKQLISIADSSSFSGQNFLKAGTDGTKESSIIASFSRDSNGSLTLGSIKLDAKSTALFNGKTGEAGLLQAGVGNTKAGGVTDATDTGKASVAAKAGILKTTADFAFAAGASSTAAENAVDGDDLVLSVKVDGDTAQDITINIADITTFDLDDVVAGLNDATNGLDGATASRDGNKLVITSATTGESSSIEIVSAKVYADGGTTTERTSATTGIAAQGPAEGADAAAATNATATTSTAFGGDPIVLDADDSISFDIAVDGGKAKTVTINQATLKAAGVATEGTIADADEMLAVVQQALTDAGVTGVTASLGVDNTAAGGTNDTGKLVFTSGTAGVTSSVTITKALASNGGNAFDATTFSISNSTSTADINDYINGIDKMLTKVTTAAADLGSVKNRIDLQMDFTSSLMDAIDRGVGTLVDADMTEESTRLKALQTQQQLGVQALSIANTSSQNLLQLFR